MLSIPLDTVAWIILKAREFDVKEAADIKSADDDGGNVLAVLGNTSDDPTVEELTNWISDLTETQKAELVALMWLGRSDDGEESFEDYLEEARGQQGERTVPYLLGTPRLGDHLEEGLEKLGISTAELESEAE
ncbi:MAG: DUF3775 domain-containing protein [Pseudomonadota bacterium]